ncbi:MAG TPA: hypothetical protein VJS37_18710 [Terriglobales bacterium]|nr:hypothetical protein [Terriglobales bacterium]
MASLSMYNPTVTALRERLGYWPMPNFTFEEFLIDLTIRILILAALTPFAFRNSPWMRPVIYFSALVLCIANARGHTLATIFGRTVSTVHFPRPAPGFISSPMLLLAGIYALVQLRRNRKRNDILIEQTPSRGSAPAQLASPDGRDSKDGRPEIFPLFLPANRYSSYYEFTDPEDKHDFARICPATGRTHLKVRPALPSFL